MLVLLLLLISRLIDQSGLRISHSKVFSFNPLISLVNLILSGEFNPAWIVLSCLDSLILPREFNPAWRV